MNDITKFSQPRAHIKTFESKCGARSSGMSMIWTDPPDPKSKLQSARVAASLVLSIIGLEIPLRTDRQLIACGGK